MIRVRLSLAAVALSVLAAGTLRADDVDPAALCDSAKASILAKKYGKAVSDLQLALAEVGRLRMEVLRTKLPGAPGGWVAQEAEGEMGAGLMWLSAGTNVKRRYTKAEDTNANVTLEVWADASGMLAGIQMMLTNPMFVPQGSKIVTIKNRRALLEYHKDDKRGSLTIMLNAPGSFAKLEGNGVASADLTDVFGNGMDLDALEKAIQE
jgi:hypothetical protein